MEISRYIALISEIIWIFPLFRQSKTKWFIFFLVLGILDPLTHLLRITFSYVGNLQYDLGSIALYLSLYVVEGKKPKESDYLFVVLLIITRLLTSIDVLFVLIVHLFIFYKILSFTVIESHLKERLNIPFLVLMLYELSILIKLSAYLNKSPASDVPYFFMLFFEMSIALFFIFFRIDNPWLLINFRRKQSILSSEKIDPD
ncbi:MAG TPA: hypothetical protein PKA80_10875 [Ignavibacteriaceae bacterium]|nr:hypothetical protein [Ignavibacteriaceae bacterium]